MARLRTNLIANFVGAGWTAAVQIACVPIFIKLLGVEAYGLIGFFVALQTTLQVLDLGISATVNRQLARYSMLPGSANEMRDFLRTLEVGYWALGAAISLAVVLLAPTLSAHWLSATTLGPSEVREAIQVMGLIVAVQWPLSFYQGGLLGLQRLVPLNLIRVLATSLNIGGAVVVLWLISDTVRGYFVWQLLGSLAHVLLIATVLWRSLPPSERRPRFDIEAVRAVLPFAKGMSGIVVLGTILAQMDKIVLSKFLTLTDFGYYTVGGIVAASLQLFITPIFSAVFPRLSGMTVNGDVDGIRRVYHAGTQIMAVCVLPSAVVLAVWAPQIVTLWTGSPEISSQVAPVAVLLLIGTAINGLMHLPYALQLAHGWTRLGLQLSLCKLFVFAPLLLWAALSYGAIGGAAIWALLNISYLLVGLTMTHRRLLQGDMWQWIVRDVGYPLLAIVAVVSIARHVVDVDATGLALALQLSCVGLVAVAVAALSCPHVRAAIVARQPPSRFSFDV